MKTLNTIDEMRLREIAPGEKFVYVENPNIVGRIAISDKGTCINCETGHVFKPNTAGQYPTLNLSIVKNGKTYGYSPTVHSVVYTAFKGKVPEGYNIDHINGDPDDYRLENLEAVECAENNRRYHNSDKQVNYLTDEQVITICELLKENKLRKKQIAKIVGCSVNVINMIINGRIHKKIAEPYNLRNIDRTTRKYTKTQVNQILNLYTSTHKSLRQISRETGIPLTSIRNIIKGKGYANFNSNKDIQRPEQSYPLEDGEYIIPYIHKGKSSNIVVTNFGRVFNTFTFMEVIPYGDDQMISIKLDNGKSFTRNIDIVIASVFSGFSPKGGYSLKHADGNINNHRPENLLVIERSDKIIDTRMKNKTSKFGGKNLVIGFKW